MSESDQTPVVDNVDPLQKVEAQFGPFAPPLQYEFEPELIGLPSRKVPPELYDGPYCRKQRLQFCAWLEAGAILGAIAWIPITKTWGLYFLPLAYLHWIAFGCLIIGLLAWATFMTRKGPFVYVEEGQPLIARVVELFLRTKTVVNGVPAVMEYVVLLQHLDPVTNQPTLTTVTHELPASAKDKTDISYRVGDYVTAVYLRSDPYKTFRLYGFLDVRHHVGLVPVGTAGQWNLLKQASAFLFGGAFFFALCWNLYAYGKYSPSAWNWQHGVVIGIGGMLVGLPMIAFILWEGRRSQVKQQARNVVAAAEGGATELSWQTGFMNTGHGCMMAVIIFAGALLLGGLTFFCWCLTLNAWLDRSQPVDRPVEIRELLMVTHNYIIREYKIEYSFSNDAKREKHEMLSTPQHMVKLLGARQGIAKVRQGYFGWEWVESIERGKNEPKLMFPGG